MSGEKKVISNANLLQKEITSLQTLAQRRVTFAIGIIYQTPEDKAEAIPAMLKEIVEADGHVLVNAGQVTFVARSSDSQLHFDVPAHDTNDYFLTRHRGRLDIVTSLHSNGHTLHYPT